MPVLTAIAVRAFPEPTEPDGKQKKKMRTSVISTVLNSLFCLYRLYEIFANNLHARKRGMSSLSMRDTGVTYISRGPWVAVLG